MLFILPFYNFGLAALIAFLSTVLAAERFKLLVAFSGDFTRDISTDFTL
jgi:hypothetical protein